MAQKVGRGEMGLEEEEEEGKFQSSVLHWCGERRSVSRAFNIMDDKVAQSK